MGAAKEAKGDVRVEKKAENQPEPELEEHLSPLEEVAAAIAQQLVDTSQSLAFDIITLDRLNTQVLARARRMAALRLAEGMWKDRTDIPKDGVKVQEQLRTEWH